MENIKETIKISTISDQSLGPTYIKENSPRHVLFWVIAFFRRSKPRVVIVNLCDHAKGFMFREFIVIKRVH